MDTHDILEQARRDIAARQARAAHDEQPWLWAFIGVAATLVIGVWFLPGGALIDRLTLVVHGVCAQAHYLSIGPGQLPLCARNTGIYAGFLATVAYLVALRRSKAGGLPPLPICALLLLGVVAMGVDGVNSLLLDMGGHNWYPPQNMLRVITGLLMGSSMAVFLPLILNLALRADVRPKQRMLGGWAEYVGLLLADALLFGLLWAGPSWLFYPLAIWSVVGISGVLFLSNIFIVSMVSGLEGRVRWLRDLSKPGTIALLLTAGELALLAGLRVAMEGSMRM